MEQNEDLSSLTNYEEKSVKPLVDGADKPASDPLFSSFQPSVQQFSYTQPAQSSFTATATATSPTPLFSDRTEKASDTFSQSAERPMVFALRSEPGAYVYEFSDRLELYRYSPFSGMVLCDTKMKNR